MDNAGAGTGDARIWGWDSANAVWTKLLVDGTGQLKTTSTGGGGGGASTIADGADVTQGATTDAAVTSDANGTLSGKLRGLVKILADVWDSANHRLKVDGSGVTQPVSAASLPLPTGAAKDSTLTDSSQRIGGTVTISGTVTGPLTDTQLRASAVPVSQSGTWNVGTLTGITNTVTVSGSVSITGTVTTQDSRLPTALGQTTMSASLPVVIASDQTALSELATAADSGALPALQKMVSGYDRDRSLARPLPIRRVNDADVVSVYDDRTRSTLNEISLTLQRILTAVTQNEPTDF